METEAGESTAIFTDGTITVTESDLVYYEQKIPLADVTAIKFGWLPIRLDMFRIGGRFLIELKTAEQKIRLNFRSFFGLFEKRQREKFNALLDVIWDLTVVRLLNELADDVDNGQTVIIGKCAITAEGILLKDFFISWEDLSFQKNYNKLTINSTSNPNVWTNLYYTETDNVHVLVYFLEWKFENRQYKTT